MARFYNLNKNDINILESWGFPIPDIKQIDMAITKTIYKLNGKKKINHKEAKKILGDEDFLSGIARSSFHASSIRENKGNSIYFDSYGLFDIK